MNENQTALDTESPTDSAVNTRAGYKFGKGQLDDHEIVAMLKADLVNYRTDIAERNTYMDNNDRYLYGDGLYENLIIPDGFDSTFHNYLRRISAVHAEQLMGQMFNVTSHYDTEDLSMIDPQDQQTYQATTLRNKMREVKAVGRQKAIQAMIRDNGHERTFMTGAQTGADYGSTLVQMWWDPDKKMIRWEVLESIQNWFPVWEDNNFRARTGDAYVYQIDVTLANSKYGKFAPTDSYTFPVTYAGDPLINIQGSSSTMTNTQGETVSAASTRRPMVTVINFTGIIPFVRYDKNGNFEGCNTGEETPLSFKVIGDLIVEKITDPDYMPRFYYIPNERVPRRPYGESVINNAAKEINATILQLKSDQLTLMNKELFPILMAKGFESGSMPKRKQREATIVYMQQEQDVKPVPMPVNALAVYENVIKDRLQDLCIITSTPIQLLLADTDSTASGQAALMQLSPMINVIEKRQKEWSTELISMFTDALNLASKHDKNIAALTGKDDGDWWLFIDWPSHMRKEDPAHQTMLINDLRAGVISVDSYMRARGLKDPDMEINRIAQDLSDKYRSAILGGKLPELAQFTIYEKLGIPLWGFNQPHINFTADITPEQQANMAHLYGWDDGPYGPSLGPQGLEGKRANENVINDGMSVYPPGPDGKPGVSPYAKYGRPFDMPKPLTQSPGGQASPAAVNPANPGAATPSGGSNTPAGTGGATPTASPVLTTGQNQPESQPMSMPGSGAPAMSSAGAQRQAHQRKGR